MLLLCRYQRLEKAFLLAGDLGDRDLFMVSHTRWSCQIFNGSYILSILFTHMCLKNTCQKAGVISGCSPLFSQPSWPQFSPLLHSNSFFFPLALRCSSMCLTPLFHGAPFAPCFTNTLNINTHTPAPSITPIALVPITSPLSSAAGKPNWKGGVKPVDLERA